MKVKRDGRIITLEIEDTDLSPNIEENIQIDAYITGMEIVISNRDRLSDILLAGAPELFDEALKDLKERWEIP